LECTKRKTWKCRRAIQSKLYDEEACVDLTAQQNNKTFFNPFVQKLLQEEKSFSDMWLRFGQEKYNYDNHFMEVSNYVKTHDIYKIKDGNTDEV